MSVSGKSSSVKRNTSGKKKTVKKGLKPTRADLEYVFIPPKKTFCEEYCLCCCKEKEPSVVSETELKDLLRQGAGRPSVVESSAALKAAKYRITRDGCSESGYLVPQFDTDLPKFTLEELRKNNKVTHHLPPPETAILNSNFRREISSHKKAKVKDDRNMTEINNMLRHRLSGTISIEQQGEQNEKDEALLRCRVTGKDYTPFMLSHLVAQSEVAKVVSANQERRQSTYSRANRSSRSSFSRASMTLEHVDYNKRNSIRLPLESSNDKEFIKYLPQASILVKRELEADWPITVSYVRSLEKYCKSHSFTPVSRKTTERWMVIFYTSSGETDDLTDFRCLLARLLLQNHFVAYEERDIALKKMPYKTQLEERLEGEDFTVPYVIARGINIGGCQIIYALHKLNLMKFIFEKYMMPEDTYAQWLYNREKKLPLGLTLDVKLSRFPALRSLIFAKSTVFLTAKDTEQVKIGKMVTEKARQNWTQVSRESFTVPDLLLFVLLKQTIINTFTIMNNIYLRYLVKASDGKQQPYCWCCRACCNCCGACCYYCCCCCCCCCCCD